jgi:hypothetical protein
MSSSLKQFLSLRLGPASANTIVPKLVERGIETEEQLLAANSKTNLVYSLSPFLAANIKNFGPYQQRFNNSTDYQNLIYISISVIVNCIVSFGFAWSTWSWFGYFSSAVLLSTATFTLVILLHQINSEFIFSSQGALKQTFWITSSLKVSGLVTIVASFTAFASGIHLISISRTCLPCLIDVSSCSHNYKSKACENYMNMFPSAAQEELTSMNTYGILNIIAAFFWLCAGLEGCLVGNWLSAVPRS